MKGKTEASVSTHYKTESGTKQNLDYELEHGLDSTGLWTLL